MRMPPLAGAANPDALIAYHAGCNSARGVSG